MRSSNSQKPLNSYKDSERLDCACQSVNGWSEGEREQERPAGYEILQLIIYDIDLWFNLSSSSSRVQQQKKLTACFYKKHKFVVIITSQSEETEKNWVSFTNLSFGWFTELRFIRFIHFRDVTMMRRIQRRAMMGRPFVIQGRQRSF